MAKPAYSYETTELRQEIASKEALLQIAQGNTRPVEERLKDLKAELARREAILRVSR